MTTIEAATAEAVDASGAGQFPVRADAAVTARSIESRGEPGVDAAPQVPPAVASQVLLRSERLARLAADAGTAAAGLVRVSGVVDGEQWTLPPGVMTELSKVVEASLAASSKTAYRSDWRRFVVWAGAGGFPALPAPPAVIAAYITAAAAEQESNGRFRYAPSTLSRWVSSINQVHAAAGLEAPGRTELVRRALSGIRRIRATPPSRRAPLLLDDIRALLDWLTLLASGWPAGVAARRDAALLLMGFAGALRRSELVALTVADVTLHRSDGLHVRIRRSKTDQEAAGAVRALPYGRDPATCAPCAWTRWRELLHASTAATQGEQRRAVMRVLRRQAHLESTGGGGEAGDGDDAGEGRHVCRTTRLPEPADPNRPLFPTVHRTGTIGAAALTGHAVREIIRRRADDAGLANVAQLGGHSLRAGFVTEAFRQGADAHAIMRQTGHRSHAMLEVYAREHAPLVGNAVTRLGL